MATTPKHRSKGKRYAPSCALSKTDFHRAPAFHGIGPEYNSDTLRCQLVLHNKIPVHLRDTLNDLKLPVPGLAYRKNKVKLCKHCVIRLEITHEQQIAAETISFDHSYASTSSDNDSSTCTEDSSVDTDSDTDSGEDDLPLLSSTPKEMSGCKRQRLHFDVDADSASSEGHISSVTQIIQQLKTLPQTELSKVARFLGESQSVEVKKDAQSIAKCYHDLDFLTSLSPLEWLDQRNPVVVNFVKGVAGHSSSQSVQLKTKPLYSLVKAIDQVYNTQPSTPVLPFSFLENAVSHSVVHSKLAANIYGLSSPGGSYWTIKNWLETQAAEPLPQPEGDCICAFDNDQVVGKTYHVRTSSKVKMSVITSVCMAEVNKAGTLQWNSSLKPIHWANIPTDVSRILDYNSHHHYQFHNTHYTELYFSLESHLKKVLSEVIRNEDGSLTDEVDQMVSQKQFARQWKVCQLCQHRNPKSKRLCETCRAPLSASSNLDKPDESNLEKTRVPIKGTAKEFSLPGNSVAMDVSCSQDGNRVKITPRDPIFVNPNSFETVKEVFLAIGKDFGIKKYVTGIGIEPCREWLLIICDGLPYILGQRVMKETFRCQVCAAIIFGKNCINEHCLTAHNIEQKDILYSLEFDWVHLKIGYGHYEMNMVRSYFELNWDVMVKDLAFTMGFCSENAQKYAKKGSDHHKSWELLCILYEGCVDELLLPYVRSCVQANIEPSPTGYLEWTEHVKSPKYQYLQEQILTYALGILNFRKGARYNNKELILSGKFKHSPIFHGRHHPKYQQIELIEARNELLMPAEVRGFVHNHQSISASGIPGRAEDMDFQLENLNKRSKVWTPHGVPTEADWLRTFRNLEKLDRMRMETLKRMGCSDPKSVVAASSSHIPQQTDILSWRETIRESGFLANCLQESVMESVGGEALDDQLVNLTQDAWSRRRQLYAVYFEGASNDNIADPIFVTPQERVSYHDIQNQTKEVIANKIKEMIEQLLDESIKFDFLELWSSVQRKKKADYILFYERVREELDSANVPSTNVTNLESEVD